MARATAALPLIAGGKLHALASAWRCRESRMGEALVRCALLGLLLFSSPGMAAMYPWEEEPASRWSRDFSNSPRDARVPLPTTQLDQEKIGEKTTVHDLFDRWVLNESVHVGRGKHYAEVTKGCKGKIELDFSLTPKQWQNPARQKRYYRSIDRLVIKVGRQLLADFGNQLSGREKKAFMRALHTLAWQESLWQHSIRYKNWFFVVLSGTSYNVLDDWGITQVARSHGHPDERLNERFFASKGYCSIGSTLYYGFMEYYLIYMDARSLSCNSSAMDKLLGAYNQYASGFSYCHDEFSEDEKYRAYQIAAMTGFGNHYKNRTWLIKMK
jgi:hypothetical protein